MNRPTRSLLTVSALAALAAAPAGPALALTGAEPSARLVHGGLGRAAPGPVADVLNPVVDMPVATGDGAFQAIQGNASVRRAGNGSERSAVRFGRGALRTSGTALTFEGLVTECVAAADGTVHGVTRLTGGRLAGGPALPALPPPNHRVPTGDGSAVRLNRQVRDGAGGMTVTGLVVDRAPRSPGGLREFGVVHCAPVAEAAAATVPGRARRAATGPLPLQGPVGATTAAGRPVLGGVVNAPGFGTAAERARPELPAVAAPGTLPLVPPSGLSGLFGGLPGLGVGRGPTGPDGVAPTG